MTYFFSTTICATILLSIYTLSMTGSTHGCYGNRILDMPLINERLTESTSTHTSFFSGFCFSCYFFSLNLLILFYSLISPRGLLNYTGGLDRYVTVRRLDWIKQHTGKFIKPAKRRDRELNTNQTRKNKKSKISDDMSTFFLIWTFSSFRT